MKKLITLTFIGTYLSSCTPHPPPPLYAWSYKGYNIYYPQIPLRPTSPPLAASSVTVPRSYYLASGHPPSHQAYDSAWLNQQSASAYTIELIHNEKASTVAQVLNTAPINERTAQAQYHDSQGKLMYLGVYGSFKTENEARTVLNSLPQPLRSTATIQSWHNIQQKIKN